MTINTIERRFAKSDRTKPRVETRADDETKKMIVGYAAVFYDPADAGTEYPLWDRAVERIMPGAFDAAIAEDDVRGLANHEPTWLLGRTKNGTARLSVDKIGLRYEIDVPDTQAGRDTVISLERGDLDGSSFAFDVHGKRGRIQWVEETIDGTSREVREIHECELHDVGPVTFPAYLATTSGLRSVGAEQTRAERDAWRNTHVDTLDLDDIDIAIAESELRIRQ
jgi:hypothetical protein